MANMQRTNTTVKTEISPEQAQEQFVTRALEEQGKAKNGARTKIYQTLLAQLSTAGAPHYYNALAKCASLIKSESNNPLDSPFSALLTFVFEVNYRITSTEASLAHIKFLMHLALSNSGLLYPCLRVFCQSFKFEDWEGREQVFEGIHFALRQILHLSPIASSSLFAAFLEMYPHQRVDTEVQQVFTKNLLLVALYSDSLRSRIVSLIVERLLALDLEVAGSGDVAESKNSELEDKLDTLLQLLFEFLLLVRTSMEPNAQEVRNSIWDCLSSVFSKTIIKAHKARYLPFLVFYHAKAYPKYSDHFLGLLRTKACDRLDSESERVHAAAYLAGFVSRAAFIHAAQMRSLFDLVLEDLYLYCVEIEEDLPEEDLELKIGPSFATAHIVFYALFQALMHMYNRRQCCDDENKEQWNQMKHVIRSYLCPFRYCLPTTVQEFRQRTIELDLIEGDEPWLDKFCPLKTLDDLFYLPFEPMALPQCKEYLKEPNLYLASPFEPAEMEPPSPSCELHVPRASKRDTSPALHALATPLLRTPLSGPYYESDEPAPLCL